MCKLKLYVFSFLDFQVVPNGGKWYNDISLFPTTTTMKNVEG
jgi:hypothetical protein